MPDSAVLSHGGILNFLEIICTESNEQLEKFRALERATPLLLDAQNLLAIHKQLQRIHFVEVSLSVSYYSKESNSTPIPEGLEDLMKTVSIPENIEEIGKHIVAIRNYDKSSALKVMVEEWLSSMEEAKTAYAKFPILADDVSVFDDAQKKNIKNILLKWEGSLARLQAFKSAFSKLEEVIGDVEEESGKSSSRPVTPQNQKTPPTFSPSSASSIQSRIRVNDRRISATRRVTSHSASTSLSSDFIASPLAQENEQLHTQLEKKATEIQELIRKLQAYERQMEKIPMLYSTIDELRREIANQEQAMANLNTEIQSHRKEIPGLNRKLSVSHQERQKEDIQYNKTLKEKENLIQQYLAQLKREKQALVKMKEENSILGREKEELDALNEELRRKIDTINERLGRAMSQLSEVPGRDNAYDTFLAFLPKIREVSSAVNNIPSLQAKISELDKVCNTLKSRLRELTSSKASRDKLGEEGSDNESNFDVKMPEDSIPTFLDERLTGLARQNNSADHVNQHWLQRLTALEKSLQSLQVHLEDKFTDIKEETEALQQTKSQEDRESRLLDDLVTPGFYGLATALSSLREEFAALTQSKNSRFSAASGFPVYAKLAELIAQVEEQLSRFCNHFDTIQRRLIAVESDISQESGRFVSVEGSLFRLETAIYELERRLYDIEASHPLNQLAERLNWFVTNLPRCFHGVLSQVYHQLEAEFLKLKAVEYYPNEQIHHCQKLLATLKQQLPSLESSDITREPYVALPWVSQAERGKAGYIPFSFFKQNGIFQWGENRLIVTPQPSQPPNKKVKLALNALHNDEHPVDNDLVLELVQLLFGHARRGFLLNISIIEGDGSYINALVGCLKAMQKFLGTPLNLQIEGGIFDGTDQEAVASEQIQHLFGPVSRIPPKVALFDPERADNISSCLMA